jgi:solute carrier family 25 uncoupling protein 8/9
VTLRSSVATNEELRLDVSIRSQQQSLTHHAAAPFHTHFLYVQVKGRIARYTGWSNGVQLVLSSSMVAGIVTTTVINPADVIRAYMQTGRGSSLRSVARSIYAAEGARGFLKGWTAAYARTGPQTLIIFTCSEIMRPLFGLAAIGGSA